MGCHYLKAACYVEFFFFIIYLYCAILKTSVEERKRKRQCSKLAKGMNIKMINKFSCHNFRNIQAEDLEFEKINILIGPNNSGKSNFIKALTFF